MPALHRLEHQTPQSNTLMMIDNFNLLRDLCAVFAPSGNEKAMKDFILEYVDVHGKSWQSQPKVIQGKEFQDCVILKFGTPRTAIFAHMDSIGFTVRYQNQLLPIGGPEVKDGYELIGADSLGSIECKLEVSKDHDLFYQFARGIDRGTSLVFKPNFRETEDFVQCCYLDNRLGVYAALKVAETLENGLLVFSCREEHGGGTVPFLCKYIYEAYGITQTLVSDITWVTEGVEHCKGVAISMRDQGLPRQQYVGTIIDIANKSGIPFQLEVEGHGASDGREIQLSPYPIDWCFVGAPEDNMHTPDEIVAKKDIASMIQLYEVLMREL